MWNSWDDEDIIADSLCKYGMQNRLKAKPSNLKDHTKQTKKIIYSMTLLFYREQKQ